MEVLLCICLRALHPARPAAEKHFWMAEWNLADIAGSNRCTRVRSCWVILGQHGCHCFSLLCRLVDAFVHAAQRVGRGAGELPLRRHPGATAVRAHFPAAPHRERDFSGPRCRKRPSAAWAHGLAVHAAGAALAPQLPPTCHHSKLDPLVHRVLRVDAVSYGTLCVNLE